MLVFTVAFLVTLWLAHAAFGGTAQRLYISEMRSQPLGHLLFFLLVTSAGWFTFGARIRRHFVSAVLGAIITLCLIGAWSSPTVAPVHDVLAITPVALLVLYAPIMLVYGGFRLTAFAVLAVVLACNGFFLLLPGPYATLQKIDAVLFLALLNLLHYRILPFTPPLVDSGKL